MASKRIIILERTRDERPVFSIAFWADVPVARQSFYARVGAVSKWIGATAADNTAIATGQVVEMIDTISMPPGATVPQIQAALQDRWSAFQGEVTNENKWVRYGTTWDETAWIAGGA